MGERTAAQLTTALGTHGQVRVASAEDLPDAMTEALDLLQEHAQRVQSEADMLIKTYIKLLLLFLEALTLRLVMAHHLKNFI
mgnify:CR=1 FL=1